MTYDYLVLAGIAASYLLVSFVVVLIALYLMIAMESHKLADTMQYCPECGGTGFNKYWEPCPNCGTLGYVPRIKEIHHT